MRNRPMAIPWQRFPGAEWYGLQSFAPMRFDGISPYLRYSSSSILVSPVAQNRFYDLFWFYCQRECLDIHFCSQHTHALGRHKSLTMNGRNNTAGEKNGLIILLRLQYVTEFCRVCTYRNGQSICLIHTRKQTYHAKILLDFFFEWGVCAREDLTKLDIIKTTDCTSLINSTSNCLSPSQHDVTRGVVS